MLFRKLGLKSKNIDLLVLTEFIGGLLFFLPVIALYLDSELGSIRNVALILAIEAFCIAAFEVPTGAIADLFGRKRTLVIANIIVLLAMVFLYMGGSFWIFAIFAVLNALARSLNSGTVSAMIYDTLQDEGKEEHYKKVICKVYALWPIGASAGSIIGGILASYSLGLAVLATMIPLSVCLILSLFLKEPDFEKAGHKNVVRHMKQSFGIIISNRQLIVLLLGGVVLWGIGESIHHMNSLFFDFKNVPVIYFGVILSVIFALSSAGHYFSDHVSDRIGNKATILICAAGASIFAFLATLADNYVAVILFVIPSLFFGLRRPVIDHLLNVEVRSKNRATIISAHNLMGYVGKAGYVLLLGYLIDLYDLNIAFRISALLMLSSVAIFLFLRQKA